MEAVIRNFLINRRGNVAMMTGLLVLPLIVVMGGAYDLVRATNAAAKLESSLQGAALAAASLTNKQDHEKLIKEYILANMQDEQLKGSNIKVTVNTVSTLNSNTVTVTATSSINTAFLKLIRIDQLPAVATAEASQSATDVELSLVMDISSSMKGNKITNLKTAAQEFVGTILDSDNSNRTSMNLVPFGGTVNIGKSLFDQHVRKNSESDGVNPNKANYNIGKNVLSRDFRFSDGDYCLEMEYGDFDGSLIPANSRGQVPHFWRWNNFNPWCPEGLSGAIFNTNNKKVLTDRIKEMSLSDGTGMDIGAAWGYKALSPDWSGKLGGDFNSRPGAYNDDTRKVLVIMTDGAITQQDRPQDYTRFNTHTNRGTNNPTSQQKSDQGNNKNKQTPIGKGNNNNDATSNTTVGQFKRICDEAKKNDIVVYTIGFQIKSGSLPDAMLKYCASDPSKYYLVESLDIGSAFKSIAASVNALRITG